MTEAKLKYLRSRFLVENTKCEWKEFKNLKHAASDNKARTSLLSEMRSKDLAIYCGRKGQGFRRMLVANELVPIV